MRMVPFKRKPRTWRRTLIWCLTVLMAPAAAAQDGRLEIEYTVRVADIPGQLFHVTTDIKNINQPALELSLPVWSPGWYVIENYAKNILRFRVTEPGGVLSANQARIAPEYAFFTGTQLFLLPEGHRSRPTVVRFDVPSGWRIASGLDDTAAPTVFTAPEYDTLVDQPTLMGQFDVTRFLAGGTPHDFVANPAGVFSAEKTRTLIGHLTKLAEMQGRIFGGLPYRKFVYFYLFRPAEAGATVLEHQNSYVALAGAQAQPDDFVAQASHEFFHVWNVKRIRPVQMWPYDYARENETPLLWVSEGFTNCYASLASYRAGLKNARSFVDEVASGVRGSRGQRGAPLHIGVGLVHIHVDRLCRSASVQHFVLRTGAEPGRTPGPLHSSRHPRRKGS